MLVLPLPLPLLPTYHLSLSLSHTHKTKKTHSDGIRLLHLLEVIGGDSIYSLCKRKYNPAPKFRIHKLENCNLIFEYLQKKDLKLTNIGSTDIVDTNEKLILGLMW